MYDTVLVPFDFSPDSEYAVKCLRVFPGLKRVTLLHVIFDWRIGSAGWPRGRIVADAVQLRLDRFKESLRWEDVEVETRVELISGGPFADVVNRVAAEEGASLVALGRRGQGVVATLLVGSFAADILRYGRQDVLLMHSPADPKGRTAEEVAACSGLFSRVMICTDFASPEIVSFCAETLPRDAAIILFHVVETGESLEEVHDRCAAAQARLKELAGRFFAGRGPVSVSLEAGDAANEILLFAREKGVSLIIMKSRGDRGLLYSLLGSTTAAVAREADRPVLVVRGSWSPASPEAAPLTGGGRSVGQGAAPEQ